MTDFRIQRRPLTEQQLSSCSPSLLIALFTLPFCSLSSLYFSLHKSLLILFFSIFNKPFIAQYLFLPLCSPSFSLHLYLSLFLSSHLFSIFLYLSLSISSNLYHSILSSLLFSIYLSFCFSLIPSPNNKPSSKAQYLW